MRAVIVMNVKLDNFLLFRKFEINMAYPKKIVGSGIPEEHLKDFPNFRYKKLITIMGANATGKTAFGKILMGAFNFITRKESNAITGLIDDKTREASFEIDFVFPADRKLVRVQCIFDALSDPESGYSTKDIHASVWNQRILAYDSYEKCAGRINEDEKTTGTYMEVLETVPALTWHFEYPFATDEKRRFIEPASRTMYTQTLKETLQTLDPRITDVTIVPENRDAYNIIYENRVVMINKGEPVDKGVLSSGTVEGIGLADMITSMRMRDIDFFYCDEKFSHVHSDAEKAYLSVMIELLGYDRQLFFTTHNLDIAEMNIPYHSFAFMKRNDNDDGHISVTYASEFLKKNTESLKNAIENDLFTASPDVEGILRLAGG